MGQFGYLQGSYEDVRSIKHKSFIFTFDKTFTSIQDGLLFGETVRHLKTSRNSKFALSKLDSLFVSAGIV